MDAPAGRTVYIVPHTHWDREWYLPFQGFRVRLVQLWDALLELAESDPGFRFLMDGQTVVIDDYLAIRPQAQSRLDRAVRQGQIQVGPWYTLPDEFLISAESLVRNLQRGIALGDAHGGAMRVGYSPDSFGHAAQMPQIYRQFGLTHAVVWRGVPSDIDRVAFEWEGPDASRILTAYLAASYSHGMALPHSGPALAARLHTAVDTLLPFHPGPDLLLMNGSDHLAPLRGLSITLSAAAGSLNGLRARLSRLDDYLQRLPPVGWPRWRGELRASSRASILPGTLSVRVADKQAYFLATLNVERRAEPLVALSGLDAAGFLDEAWTLLLQNAAHDTACGSVVDEAAEEARVRSLAAAQIANATAERGLARLADDVVGERRNGDDALEIVVWNPCPFPRTGNVVAEVPAAGPDWVALNAEEALAVQSLGPAQANASFTFAAKDVAGVQATLDQRRIPGEVLSDVRFQRKGRALSIQIHMAASGTGIDLDETRSQADRLAREPGVETVEMRIKRPAMQRLLIPTGMVEGCSVARVVVRPGRAGPVTGAVRVGGDILENDRLACRLDHDGTLFIHDLGTDMKYAGLHRLVDEGDAGDAYDFSPPAVDAPVCTPARLADIRCLEAGPLRGTVELRMLYRVPAALAPDRQSRLEERVDLPITLRISLQAGSPQVDCELELLNQARDHRLRVHFPLPFAATHAEADGAYHVTSRAARPPWHEPGAPEWELPTHPLWSFVDVADDRGGLALLTEGLHEYELLAGPGPGLALTLARAVGWLSRDDLRYRIGHAGPGLQTPGTQVQGRLRHRYSLHFHAGGWEAAGIWRASEMARLPLEVAAVRLGGDRPMQAPARIDLRPATLQMTACIPRSYGYDLRLLNASARAQENEVRLVPAPSRVVLTILSGQVLRRLVADGDVFHLNLKPWQIATLRVASREKRRAGRTPVARDGRVGHDDRLRA